MLSLWPVRATGVVEARLKVLNRPGFGTWDLGLFRNPEPLFWLAVAETWFGWLRGVCACVFVCVSVRSRHPVQGSPWLYAFS